MASKLSPYLTDKECLDSLISAMPPVMESVYRGFEGLALESAFPGRKMVVYTLERGQPQDIDILTFGDITMDARESPVISYKNGRGFLKLGVVPTPYEDRDLFLSVPQNFVFKWSGKRTNAGVEYAPHYAVLIKTRSREHLQIEGDTYCVALNKFLDRFPQTKLRY